LPAKEIPEHDAVREPLPVEETKYPGIEHEWHSDVAEVYEEDADESAKW
jgi:hypothetical protein